MGKNLKVGSAEPRAYLTGPQTAKWLTVSAARAYQLAVRLPQGLQPGSYQVFAHNGSGGPYGWSELVQFDLLPAGPQGGLQQFEAAQFGAKPDDGGEDTPAIQEAVNTAAKAGGG
jgi:hypothetical protein